MTQPLQIELSDWGRAKAFAQPLRTAVFVSGQGVPADMEWDEWDGRSVHAIGRIGERAVGTGRLLPADARGAVRIGRMAVVKECRGRGIGAAILRALMQRASNDGAVEAVLHAQSYAADFYRRFGFKARGGEFFEAGIAHVEMARALPSAPADAVPTQS